jgi:hypothetical protein
LWRHQESERHFEGVVNLVAVQLKCKARSHARDHGHDAMAPGGYVNVEIAERLDKAAGKRDLLLGLTQSGRSGAFVAGIDLAAGKRNLPGAVR